MIKKIALTAVTLPLTSLLFIDIPAIIPVRLMLTLWPMGHVVVFALFAFLLLTYIPKLKQGEFGYQFFWLTMSAFTLGISIELIQPFFSRSTELEDLLFNYLGTLLVLIMMGNLVAHHKLKQGLQALFSALLIYFMLPSILTAYDEYRLIEDFPVITTYDNETSLTRWKADASLTIFENEKRAQHSMLKATFITKSASRVVLRYFNEDWQNSDSQINQKLQLRFFNPEKQALPLTIIMTDKHYDKSHSNSQYRFQKKVMLSAGWSTHLISLFEIKHQPNARNIDLTKMAGIDFYMYKLAEPITILIDQIRIIP